MNVDKNLFLYDCAIVSIMKNATPYVKEWLDYHLLAGVDHFYIYDNDSEDNFEEVLQPYIDAGLVTYTFYPGQCVMMEAFNEAIDKYKFFCRYITFVDDDEFILPKHNLSIVNVVDGFFGMNENISGVDLHWMPYGSNGQKTADYSRGVLERFTRRASTERDSTKTILNPRRVNFMWTPHFAIYFDGFFDFSLKLLEKFPDIGTKVTDKIIMNHYHTKSLEEFVRRKSSTDANFGDPWEDLENRFKVADENCNEVFDNEILRYRDEKLKALLETGEGKDFLTIFAESKRINFDRLVNTLAVNLLFGFSRPTPKEFFKGKLENYLTCLALSTYLKENYFKDERGRLFEEMSLYAIYNACKTLYGGFTVSDLQLLMREMPRILTLPYPIVEKIRFTVMQLINTMKDILRRSTGTEKKLAYWKDICEWQQQLKMLEVFENYTHK